MFLQAEHFSSPRVLAKSHQMISADEQTEGFPISDFFCWHEDVALT